MDYVFTGCTVANGVFYSTLSDVIHFFSLVPSIEFSINDSDVDTREIVLIRGRSFKCRTKHVYSSSIIYAKFHM